MRRSLIVISVCVPIWLQGCATTDEQASNDYTHRLETGSPMGQLEEADPDDPFFAAMEPQAEPAEQVPTGSIYQPGVSRGLYQERSHFHVGDIISVQLEESTKATKKGTTSLKKTSQFNLEPIGVPGGNLEIGDNEVQLDLDQEQTFKGDGTASQSNGFEGELTVAVTKVLRNDNLVIRGDKWLLINNGKEYIRLTGVIRAKDVNDNNTIDSSKIANARIEYSGTGSLADSQRLGWLADKLNDPEVWPF